jgi:succinate dehydrogenase / fumarate reductase cytochrome b subunit
MERLHAMPDLDARHHTLRRLHSLTGLVPIGAFVLVHLFTNYKSTHGAAAYNEAARQIASLPFVVLIELFGIGLPILLHLVLGIVIVATARPMLRIPGARHTAYVLQRATGIVLAAFIVWHVWATRFSGHADGDLFVLMQEQLRHPAVFAFYVLGVLSAAYHLGNGLFGFSIHWGIAVGRRAQAHAARLGLAVALFVAFLGINALLGFVGRPLRLFERDAGTVAQQYEARR